MIKIEIKIIPRDRNRNLNKICQKSALDIVLLSTYDQILPGFDDLLNPFWSNVVHILIEIIIIQRSNLIFGRSDPEKNLIINALLHNIFQSII